jgi:hypothetical protein
MDLRRVRERRKEAVLPTTVADAAMNHLEWLLVWKVSG